MFGQSRPAKRSFFTRTIYCHRSILRGQAPFEMTVPKTDTRFADKEVENVADWRTTLTNEKRIQKNVRGFRKENPTFNSVLLIRY